MTTLRDISRHLNLSVTQVSRALNGHSDVNEDTRQRVLDAAKALKYQPNLTARKLVMGKSGIVGLVLPAVPTAPEDSLFVQIVGGLSRHFSTRAMQFVLHIAAPEDDIVEVYRKLINSGSLDGFVLLEPTRDDPRIAYLRERKVPFVLHGRHESHPDYPFFDIDNEGVAHTLTRYLTDRGHHRIAFLNGQRGRTYAEARQQGYARALAEAGILYRPDFHIHDEMTEGAGLLNVVRLWASPDPKPTAIICGSTLISRGVFHSLAALGLTVPRDVSVVVHDDERPGIRPTDFPTALTATHSPLELSWKPLAEILANTIDGAPMEELQQLGEIRLIERDSVAMLNDMGMTESPE
jgi:LacI family transcriptional regulator